MDATRLEVERDGQLFTSFWQIGSPREAKPSQFFHKVVF